MKFPPFVISLAVCLSVGHSAGVASQNPQPEPVLAIEVESPILAISRNLSPVSTKLSVVPLHFPVGTRLVYQWRQVQDEMGPMAAKMDQKPIAFSAIDKPEVVATFPDSGVYEVRLTVTDPQTKISASRNTWINVWDSRSPIAIDGKPDPLAVVPGMTPPKVRTISPDPGPFQHPRLYCTDAEWKDINDRCVQGKSKIASAAWGLATSLVDRWLNPKSAEGAVFTQLEAYADAGYKGPMPALSKEVKEASRSAFISGLGNALAHACFAQWVKNDPSIPMDKLPPDQQVLCRKMAKLVAAFSRVALDSSWDRKSRLFKKDSPSFIQGIDSLGERCGTVRGIALAYDFIAPWMTPDQLRDTRNLLIAAGLGRKGDGQRTGHSNAAERWVERGYNQNGNFPNLGEGALLTGLVISGEESGADPEVVEFFTQLPRPAELDDKKSDVVKKNSPTAYDWVQPVETDTGRDQPLSKPYPEAMTWVHARKADVNNLQREVWGFADIHISPWGFTLERLAYFGSMTDDVWPMALVYARLGGYNQYVGSYYYQTVNNVLFAQYPSGVQDNSKSFSNHLGMYEHHSGGGDYRQQHILMLKYMYPDDPLVDYVYATQAPQIENRVRNVINTCIFGLDPKLTDLHEALAPIAEKKALPLTKLDPKEGIVVMRSGWKDDDLMLYLDAGFDLWGHMNGERSGFSFFALGRHWSVPTGFHKVFGNFQSIIMTQNPAWASCPVTQGFMGVNPCYTPDGAGGDYAPGFPTPPTHLLEVKESPDRLWSLAACDAATSYNYICGSLPNKPNAVTILDLKKFMYPGLAEALAKWDPTNPVLAPDACRGLTPVVDGSQIQQAVRTALVVRGKRPYALIVDDFRKGGAPANYRWMLSDKTKVKDDLKVAGPEGNAFSVMMAPRSTPTEATLLDRRDQEDKPGQPRLLVRDVSESDNAK